MRGGREAPREPNWRCRACCDARPPSAVRSPSARHGGPVRWSSAGPGPAWTLRPRGRDRARTEQASRTATARCSGMFLLARLVVVEVPVAADRRGPHAGVEGRERDAGDGALAAFVVPVEEVDRDALA